MRRAALAYDKELFLRSSEKNVCYYLIQVKGIIRAILSRIFSLLIFLMQASLGNEKRLCYE